MNYSDILSTIAIGGTAVSLWLHYQKHMRDQENIEPDIKLRTKPASGTPGWAYLTVTVRNNDRFSMEGERIRIVWPPRASIVRYRDCAVTDGQGGLVVPAKIPAEMHARSKALRLTLAPNGTAPVISRYRGAVKGTSDTDHDSFLVSVGTPGWLRFLARRERSSCSLTCWISISSSRKSRSVFKSVRRFRIVAAEHDTNTQ